ncbi:Uncharacterized protein BP5553_10136 [Venustampulla echinocandica]|uniref:non-reducing end alpha-L-arabinofuranosidase n=1 Tax=Venustampulla echinocandica TaxID=2656787 RepID=A0A370TAI2_9HELO|nr:Uncharacterized protein BP5553_10136 [Venustampulla echinocandica]RDL30791.1 Uncharacterized protein BP5553_10136 [Venustampulla echinocandica]
MLYSSCAVLFATAVHAITVSVSGTGGVTSSPLLYGLMFEDINNSGDGGLYAELIKNRGFQGDSLTAASLSPWTAVGGATLTLQSTSPLSSALPQSVNVKGKANTAIGISNPGYWGIEVKPQTYTGSFYVMGSYSGLFTANLQAASGGKVYAQANITSESKKGSWTKHTFTLKPPSAAPDTNNVFSLSFTPTSSSQTLNFNLISLFPPTYNNRPNGMRPDLMNALKDLNPSFLRLPGGNNLEGGSSGNEWKWEKTLGDLTERPGRTGDWGYYNTDGIGIIEYLLWCQDLDVEPVLGVFAGMNLNGDLVPESSLQTYVQDSLNELEFLMGSASTTYGKKRIALGYPEPFPIKYVEVGNEDNLNNGLASYNSYRFAMFHNAIIEKYPDMKIIASTTEWKPQIGNSIGDAHEYNTPDIFASEFHKFDKVTKEHMTLVGEYAAVQANLRTNTSTDWDAPFVDHPWWIGAVSEAIYELGAERNSDRVIGLSYAPLLQNMDSHQWHPDLISFNADTSKTTLSTSYERIKLFSNNRFTAVLPMTSSAAFGPAYYVAGINDDTDMYIFKAAVYNTTSEVPFTLSFPGTTEGRTARLTLLTAPGGAYAMNTFGGPNAVDTNVSTITASGSGFSFSLPQWSIAVLTTGRR